MYAISRVRFLALNERTAESHMEPSSSLYFLNEICMASICNTQYAALFRRLCILKGIYPQEPNRKRTLNKGSTAPRTYYYVKDIAFLAHESLIDKYREFKVFIKRLKKAIGREEDHTVCHLLNNKPNYTLDHIIRERLATELLWYLAIGYKSHNPSSERCKYHKSEIQLTFPKDCPCM